MNQVSALMIVGGILLSILGILAFLYLRDFSMIQAPGKGRTKALSIIMGIIISVIGYLSRNATVIYCD